MSNTFAGGIKLPFMNPASDIISETVVPSEIFLEIPDGFNIAVSCGDTVLKGDAVAVPSEDTPGLPLIPSGVSGKVTSVEEGEKRCVTIENDCLDKLSEKCVPVQKTVDSLSEEEITEILLKSGITPPAKGKHQPVCLIVSCCERDSHSSSVTCSVYEDTKAIIGGTLILMKLLGAGRAVCAVPKPMYKCADALSEYIADRRLIKIKFVSEKYPQYLPHLLVSSLFNIEINPLLSTADAGYPSVSAPFCAAVYNALAKGLPYTSSIITVCGDNGECGNFRVPFGTKTDELISLCGYSGDPIVYGGIMTGEKADENRLISGNDFTVMLGKAETEAVPHTCIDCGKGISVCPSRLSPCLIYEYSAGGNIRIRERLGAEYCIACGCCTAVCPAGIDLQSAVLSEKEKISEKGNENEEQ